MSSHRWNARLSGVLILLAMLWIGCGSSNKAVPLQFSPSPGDPAPVLHQRPATIEASDGSVLLNGYEVESPSDVVWFDADLPSGRVLLGYGTGEDASGGVVAYDLADEAVLWTARSNATRGVVRDSVWRVSRAGEEMAVSDDGTRVRWKRSGSGFSSPSGALWIRIAPHGADEEGAVGTALRMRPNVGSPHEGPDEVPTHVLTAYDAATNAVRWRREVVLDAAPGEPWTAFEGDTMYLASKGVEQIDLVSGAGWYIPRSTSGKGVVGAIAKDVAIGVLAAAVGQLYLGSTRAKQTHHLMSPPSVGDRRACFGARREILCADKASGRVRWSTTIEDASGVLAVHEVGPDVVVLDRGWAYVDQTVQKVGASQAVLLDGATGEIQTVFRRGEDEPLIDARPRPLHLLVLSPYAVYQFDHDLQLLGTFESSESMGDFVEFVDVPDGVLIRATHGILALSEAPFGVAWRRPLPPVLLKTHRGKHLPADEYVREKWAWAVVDDILVQADGSWSEVLATQTAKVVHDHAVVGEHLWASTEGGYAVLDPSDGRVVAEIAIPDRHTHALGAAGLGYAEGERLLLFPFEPETREAPDGKAEQSSIH